MTSCLDCSGKIMSSQAYIRQAQKETTQPQTTQPAETAKPEALNAGGNRGTVLNVKA